MKTDTLIDLLSRQAGPAPRALAARRLSPAAFVGLLVGALAAITWFGTIPAHMFATAVPWTKMAYTGTFALAAGWLTARLSRPAAPLHWPLRVTVAVVGIMALAGGASLLFEPSGGRVQALLGNSWSSCPWNVLALSLPGLAAALWAVRGLAPTRPRAAGFAAGLMAGSLGAIGYSLSCPQTSAAFLALWYSLGMVLTGAVGAVLGPRVLRW